MTGRRFATRLNSFRERGARGPITAEELRRVAAVPGIGAIELNFPQHLDGDGSALFSQIAELGLELTALNLRFDDRSYALGAFTNPDVETRDAAIRLCQEAVETAADHGIRHVILWLGPDGYDYPFQAGYAQLWRFEIEGLRRVTEHNPQVRLSIEYKPSDPRRFSLVRSMPDALLAVHEVGLPNLGVTLDFCHALMAGEQPAAAASLALRQGRLFGVHLNDGYGSADDGMSVGAVHPWQTLELLWELRRGGFDGTIYFDTFPERMDAAAETGANIQAVIRFEQMLDLIQTSAIDDIQARQDGLEAARLLQGLLDG